MASPPFIVVAGLDPAIHAFITRRSARLGPVGCPDHVWMAPALQGAGDVDVGGRLRSCVRPLLVRSGDRWPRWDPRWGSRSRPRDRCPIDPQISPSLGRLTTSVGTFSSQASRCALVGPRPQTVATASRKPVWRTITAQVMRAILLASATAATMRGLVSSSRLSHGSVLARLLPSTARAPLISSRRR